MKHLLLFFIAILSLSQSANIVRMAAAPALMIGFWRLLGAGFIMLGLRWVQARRSQIPFWEAVPAATWKWSALSGTLFFFHLWTFFLAAQHTTIANCMVIFATNPLFTAIGSRVLLKDPFEKRHAYAFGSAFVGIIFLASQNLSWENGLAGDLSALFSAIFFSGYLLASKKARLHMNTEQFTGSIYLWASALFLIFGLSQGVRMTDYPDWTWMAIAAHILFPTLLGHVLFTHLLKYFNINWMSCGKLLEPGFSALIAYFAFRETLRPETSFAFVFFAISVVILFSPHLLKRSVR